MASELQQEAQRGGQATAEVDEFSSLLKQSFKPRTERAETEIDNAVKHAGQAGAGGPEPDQGRCP